MSGVVKASELVPGVLARRSSRKCRDCLAPNPPTAGFNDPLYCPNCVAGHTSHCATCTTLFVRDGANTDCPSCRAQLGLFGGQP